MHPILLIIELVFDLIKSIIELIKLAFLIHWVGKKMRQHFFGNLTPVRVLGCGNRTGSRLHELLEL